MRVWNIPERISCRSMDSSHSHIMLSRVSCINSFCRIGFLLTLGEFEFRFRCTSSRRFPHAKTWHSGHVMSHVSFQTFLRQMRLWSIGPSDSDKIAKQLFLYRRENLLVCFSFHRVVSRVQIQFIFRVGTWHLHNPSYAHTRDRTTRKIASDQ